MYSIVIPVFNEAQTIPELIRRLTPVMDSIGDTAGVKGSKGSGPRGAGAEVIFVDDASSDETFAILSQAHNTDARFKAIRFSRNFGHQIAITAGMDHASGEAIILMDGDLQDPPELIPRFIEEWKKGFEVVYAVKRNRKEFFLKRYAFALFYRLLHSVSTIHIPMDAGNFSLLDKRVLGVLRQMPERNRYISGMRAWAGFRQTGIEFDREARFAGKPQMSLTRLVNLALDGIFSFSKAPLRLGIYIGLFSAFLAFLGTAYVIYAKVFTDRAIIGWTSVMLAITFLGGMILVTIGIIGEYIGRIFDEVKQRPLYIVGDRVGVDSVRT
jgi:dolichol-phosphate mannosyltransferase